MPLATPLKKFADRLNVLEIIEAMFRELVQKFALDAEEAPLDSTGVETTSASAHLQSHKKNRTKYVKLWGSVLVGSLIPSGLSVS